MRILIVIAVMILSLMSAGATSAEDGMPAAAKPTNCVQIDLDGSADYVADPSFDTPQCVDGGSGSNTIWTFGGNDWMNGKGGSDPEHGGDGQDVMYGGDEGDHQEGEGGDDYIYAGCPGGCATPDLTPMYYGELEGGGGNDHLAACNNLKDVLRGGSGYDVLFVDPKKDIWRGAEKVVDC